MAFATHVLIAGCGYLGTVLGDRLAARGVRVTGLRRNACGLPRGIMPFSADLADPFSLRGLPGDIDAVVYAASAGDYTPEAYASAYVAGVENLLAALNCHALRRFIFVSSTGVYGQQAGEWVDEDSPAEAGGFAADALRQGETLAASGPFPATVVRFSGIYGPGRTRMIDSVRAGTARCDGGPPRYLNHIHRDDAAGFLDHLLALRDPASLYLGSDDEPVDRNEALCWIAARLGLPVPPLESGRQRRGTPRRYRNTRMRATGYKLVYPTYREGYGALMDADSG